MSGPAFGVELPDNIGSEAPSSESAVEEKVSGTETAPETPKGSLDLDSVEKFRFDGREWTPKELKSAYMFQSDYSKKTAEVAEQRKYAENFDADLEKVVRDPSLMAQLRDVYPKNFVAIAEQIIRRVGTQNTPSRENPGQASSAPDPRDEKLSKMESKFSEWERSQREAEEAKIGSWLDNQFSTLGTKYPLVNSTLQEVVSARAEVLANRGTEITDKVLDKLFKQVNDDVKAHMDKTYKVKVDEQIKAGSKAKDTGSGGGVPGQAPKTDKTIKQATDRWLADLERGRP